MAPQALITKVTSSRPANVTDISIEDATTSADTKWLKKNMQQLMDNQAVIKEQLNIQKY